MANEIRKLNIIPPPPHFPLQNCLSEPGSAYYLYMVKVKDRQM